MGQVAAKEQYSESETDTEVEEEALGVDHFIILRGGGVGVGEFKKIPCSTTNVMRTTTAEKKFQARSMSRLKSMATCKHTPREK